MRTVNAQDLKPGDRFFIDGDVRTVEHVTSGGAETRIDLAGRDFPVYIICWRSTRVPLEG